MIGAFLSQIMTVNESSRRLKAAVAVLAVILAVSAPVFALVARATTGEYDEARNRAQLEKIGRALQLYRAEYGFVEPARRGSYSDAGLPLALNVLFEVPGKPWSLSRADFDPPTRRSHLRSTFAQMYWTPRQYAVHGDVSSYFRTRGEQLIILLDPESEPELWKRPDGVRDVMVLRLNGTVGRVRFNQDVFMDWASK
jgi:hypothetical protein